MGDDTSGQTNDYSASASGMNAHDQIKGSPTNNFCSFNENATRHITVTMNQGGYKFETTQVHKTAYGNQTMTSGKWYWEARSSEVTNLLLVLLMF